MDSLLKINLSIILKIYFIINSILFKNILKKLRKFLYKNKKNFYITQTCFLYYNVCILYYFSIYSWYRDFEKIKNFLDNFLSLKQIAEIIFFNKETLRNKIKQNKIPSVYVKRIGNKYFLHKNCIDIFKKILGV